ncbi:MAG: tetratricopeptide repeat protein [Burkholderiales bacterium]|nr:tetratricopeptide repeat protein [Burkholderiales bacterium]
MYDPDEQQQLDDIKKWFKRHGKKMAALLAVALISLSGVLGYKNYQHGQEEKASAMYDSLVKMDAGDLKKVRLAASAIVESYPKTPYAARSAMYMATLDFGSGDLNDARLQLQWVLDHAAEPDLKDIARLRFARVLFDENKYQDAFAMLDTKHNDAYDGLYSDLKGDIYLAQGKREEARSAYLMALNKSDAGNAFHNYLQIKLESTGGAK